ncbi:MAG: gamma-glutamyltranspeptidase/glutathione hydrolase [Gammaproteobacteria bacterium]|jgi:gamma-glutamyltranspeptidase/glutathione hydrolase
MENPLDLNRCPFPSRRSPVLSANGVVAASQPLAAQAGLSMLQKGGNAVDAALATAMALTVLEPTSNGIGSDAFALIWDGKQLHGLNASGRWPAANRAQAMRDAGHLGMPQIGWPTVTVPGCVSMWGDLSERFGTLDATQLLEPAIGFARDGFPVSPVISQLWARAQPNFAARLDPGIGGWTQTFTRDGQVPGAGDMWRSPGHARCLQGLADRGFGDFYCGEIAAEIIKYAATTGGLMSAQDLAEHRNEWVQPISARYGDVDVWEIPPNGQGIAALQALAILDGLPARDRPPLDAQRLHLQIEAMKLGFGDAYTYVADPQVVAVPVQGMLDPDYLAARRALIGERARMPDAGSPPKGGTVYLCAADRNGMMVSLIQSNYHGFGSGVVVPELGLALQNRASGFVLQPGHLNEAAPGKRPRHTIIPGFLTRAGEALGPFGVMGGEIQPQGHLQVVAAMQDHGMSPQAALDMPRWKWTVGQTVEFEPGTDSALIEALRARGHDAIVMDDSLSFGRGQIIRRLSSGAYAAGSEPRTDGAAVGY